ncbi:MAG: cyclophilin-like fold protein [Candidatus Acetothermia bacterium]
MKVEIVIGSNTLQAELNETQTASAVGDLLPLSGSGKLWGDEIYFPIPLEMENEKPKKDLTVGDLAYWPQGNAFCIFFGPTPASEGDEPRPASPVTVFGSLTQGTETLQEISREQLDEIQIRKA